MNREQRRRAERRAAKAAASARRVKHEGRAARPAPLPYFPQVDPSEAERRFRELAEQYAFDRARLEQTTDLLVSERDTAGSLSELSVLITALMAPVRARPMSDS